MTAEEYMCIAIEEAKRGLGHVDPNPLVGAVIVKDGKIISKDCHRRYGGYHAERNAILNCSEDLSGADIYVTLEPCCHHGKTPPCTDIIIQSGIKRVFIGSGDPNPLVAGKGAEILRSHGIEVRENVMKDGCDRLNRMFFHYITKGTPYVLLKYAMTADGKTASFSSKSKWISNLTSRFDVQKLRLKYPAIMAGINTVLKDDPRLTCRLENSRDPMRVICDSTLRIPADSYIMKTAERIPTVIACSDRADSSRAAALEGMGAQIIRTQGERVDLLELMKRLGEKKISGVLLEGGGQLAFSALKSGIVNHITAYIAPKLLGGASALTPVEGQGFDDPMDCVKLSKPEVTAIDDDVRMDWEVM